MVSNLIHSPASWHSCESRERCPTPTTPTHSGIKCLKLKRKRSFQCPLSKDINWNFQCAKLLVDLGVLNLHRHVQNNQGLQYFSSSWWLEWQRCTRLLAGSTSCVTVGGPWPLPCGWKWNENSHFNTYRR